MVQRREVHPNLVCTAGFQVYVEQACGDERFDGVVMGQALPTVGRDGEFPVVATMTADRCVDGAAGRVRMSLHQSVITLVDRALLERPLEQGVRPLGDRYDHDSGGTDVEAMHDALSLVHSRGGDPVAGRVQPTDACAATPAGLSTATMSSSEYRIVMPSISTGVFSSGAGGSGSRTCSHAPAVRWSDLPAGTPSSSTPPSSASA